MQKFIDFSPHLINKQIRRIFLDHRRLYGSKKIWEILKNQGAQVA
ncbi:IS3 family transposase [Paenibacillus elgii]